MIIGSWSDYEPGTVITHGAVTDAFRQLHHNQPFRILRRATEDEYWTYIQSVPHTTDFPPRGHSIYRNARYYEVSMD